jgi:GT2 family glycosyltransferase
VRAVNEAARRASGDALVLVNDDCVCDPTFVERLVARLAPTRGVVMAAGVLRDARNPGLIDTAGIAVDASLLIFDYLNGEPLERLGGARDPIGPCGAAAAYDRAAFLEAGGFDDALFAYWEDIDLALRLRLAGGACALAPDAQGTHRHSATLGSGSPAKNYLVGFGRGYTLRKWSVLAQPRPALQALIGDAAICAGQLIADRNVAGLRGRVAGYRAARASTRRPYPAGLLPAPSRPLNGSLRPRLRRRLRLRATA